MFTFARYLCKQSCETDFWLVAQLLHIYESDFYKPFMSIAHDSKNGQGL